MGIPSAPAANWDTISSSGAERKILRCGTHRSAPLASTLARVMPHLHRIGVTRLADVTGLDCVGVPVVMAVRPLSRSVSVHQGKGLSLMAAKVSAAMEAVESWHAQNLRLALHRASPSDLARDHRHIDLDRLPVVGEPEVDRHLAVRWIRGSDLMDGQPVYVPAQLVHTDFCVTRELPGLPTSSNGLAAGNSTCEALCAAICELIERDCTALLREMRWSQRDALRIDLDSIGESSAAQVIGRFHAANLIVQIWDMTSDIGVPAFSCRVFEYAADNRPVIVASIGHGCHLDPDVALTRALTEAAQARLTVIAGSRDDVGPEFYRPPRDGNESLAMEDISLPGNAHVDFRSLTDLSTSTIDGDLRVLLARLRAAGLSQVVWVDLTQDAIGIPVVRVIIPGLGRQSKGNFARGRRPHGGGV